MMIALQPQICTVSLCTLCSHHNHWTTTTNGGLISVKEHGSYSAQYSAMWPTALMTILSPIKGMCTAALINPWIKDSFNWAQHINDQAV